MKKAMFLLALLLVTMGAKAQFEQGKWFVNPAATGLGLSYDKVTDVRFGLDAKGGAFVIDNLALLVGLGAEFMDDYNRFNAGVGARYYFNKSGIYVGAGFDLTRYSISKHSHTDFDITAEVGYAFFITKTVTLEPAVYCRLNTKDGDYTKYGLKIGFGIYF
ncbi:hypothetical protein LJC21_02390 [Bacteroides sp. OttesenSCG-928-E20]|nr:hypothetical protein [Bacteroides sp. OttesenSCG-928-N06]MDL2299538.1 hypothetical protein [Bacteroides sp. OttesenSCG-928-E20]